MSMSTEKIRLIAARDLGMMYRDTLKTTSLKRRHRKLCLEAHTIKHKSRLTYFLRSCDA